MQSDPDVKLRENIHQKAAAYAEATVYTLGNTYLSQEKKTEVEFWFQLPGNVMLYSFVIVAIWSVVVGPLPWSKIIGIPLAVNVIVGLLNWHFYNKNFVYKLYLTFLHSWILYLVGFGAAAFLFFKGVQRRNRISDYIFSGALRPIGIHRAASIFLLYLGQEIPNASQICFLQAVLWI